MLSLALDAVPGPGHSLQPFLLDFLLALHALSVRAVFHALQRLIHELQHPAILVALVEQKLFGVRVRGLVGDVLCGLFVGLAPIFFRIGHQSQQLLLFGQKAPLVVFNFLLIHALPYFLHEQDTNQKLYGWSVKTVKHKVALHGDGGL